MPSSTMASPTSPMTTITATASALVIVPPPSSCPSTIPPEQTGLIVGISLLAGLLSLSLLTLTIVLSIGKRSAHRTQDRELHRKLSEKATSGVPASQLESHITSLELQLRSKEVQLQETHAALLQQGPRASGNAVLSEAQIREQFETLATSSRQWTLKWFGEWALQGPLNMNAMPPSQRDRSNYGALLKAPRTACLVLQGLLGEIISQAFTSGALLASRSFSDLNATIGEAQVGAIDYNDWRALTSRLLEKSPDAAYRSAKTEAIDSVCRRIEDMVTSITGLEATAARARELRRLVEMSSTLAAECAKHLATYRLERPNGSILNSERMDAIPHDHDDRTRGKSVLLVVWPATTKWGTSAGTDYEKCSVVLRAQVLV